MRQPIRLVLVGLLCCVAGARGEQVQLPYQAPADAGNFWMVYFQGQLQQQGNGQQTFQQAGMINVNGRQPQPQGNNQQASLDDKTRELLLNFNSTNNNPLRHSRRIKFDEETGIARIIDVFENAQDREFPARITLTSSVNFGVNNARIVDDPKEKKSQLAWVADVGNGRGAVSWLAGKGSKITPVFQYNQGNNQVAATFTLKVPAKETVAIVHWHGVFGSGEEAIRWIGQSRESKLLADVEPALRKAIVNTGQTATTLGNFELLRGEASDVIELRGGDQLRGKIEMTTYALDTAFGSVELPADKILGMMSLGDFNPRQVLVTTAGEIIGGRLKDETIGIELASGRPTRVPVSQVSRIGFATSTDEEPAEFDLNKPMLFLRSGERCLVNVPAGDVEFVTRLGTLKVPASQIALAVLIGEPGTAAPHELYLIDGSRLVGILPQTNWAFRLTSATGAGEVSFAAPSIARVQLAALPEDIGVNAPALALSGGDVLAARLNGKVRLTTAFDTLEIDASEIRAITRPDPVAPTVQVVTADQTTLRGELAVAGAADLVARVAGGIEIAVPIAAVSEYTNPRPMPGAALTKQVRDVIRQLDAEDWKERESAEPRLIAFGPTVLAVLEEALPEQSPEARQRLQAVITRIKKELPPAISRLPSPPVLE